ncbi:phytase [Marinobacter lacisalsi]|uniref:Phytase n=1 Tax=Marinobacter lacisalsi TaxID=475979 RepID=A0ABV8QPH2_9GAMM
MFPGHSGRGQKSIALMNWKNRMSATRKRLFSAAIAIATLAGCSSSSELPEEAPVLDTLPLSGEWARATESKQGWVVTNEQNGIALVELDGDVVDSWETNAEFLDARSVRGNAGSLEVFASYNPESGEPLLFTVSPQGKTIENRTTVTSLGFPIEGLCLFNDTDNGDLYLFALSEKFLAHQYLVTQSANHGFQLVEVRNLPIPAGAETCAANDVTDTLFVAEEGVGIWAYSANPEADLARSPVAMAEPFGALGNGPKGLDTIPGGIVAFELGRPFIHLVQATGDGYKHHSSVNLGEDTAPDSITATASSDQVRAVLFDENSEQLKQTNLSFTATDSSQSAGFKKVLPVVETDPVPVIGDAADDPEIWVNERAPGKSLILGTDKRNGLLVYNLEGEELQSLNVGRINNVDVRYGVPYQGKNADIAVGTNRTRNSLSLFAIDRERSSVIPVTEVPTGLSEIYGFCMYQSDTGTYAIANDKDGRFHQLRLTLTDKSWTGELVREFKVASQPEGCVADDRRKTLFVGEEDEAIWALGAEPDSGHEMLKVDSVGEHLTDDIEGLTFYRGETQDYLVASSQGDNTYVIYNAKAPHQFRGKFRIGINHDKLIDGASETDGIAATSADMGGIWSEGMLVVQDGRNVLPSEAQNFKYVPWSHIRSALDLER